MRRHLRFAAATIAIMLAGTVPANAVHWYRGPADTCTPDDGATTDDPGGISGPNGATVRLLHNAYENAGGSGSITGFSNEVPTTTIDAGESVTWTWNSSHCHSVLFAGGEPNSGMHYPTAAPESQQVVPGYFDYPVLDETPTLSWTHTFTSPGTYAYSCKHHGSIGMRGTLVVV